MSLLLPEPPSSTHLDELADALMAIAEHGGQGMLAEFLTTLSDDDMALAEDVLAHKFQVGWRSDPASMAHHLAGAKEIRLWRYTRLLSHKFTQLVDGTSKRQIWNMPARYGKSLWASRWGPAWALDRRPESKIIISSYAYNLAREHCVAVRDILREYSDQMRCQLRADVSRADRFATDAGGGILAAGMAGQITGFGAGNGGGVIIDDPFKDWPQAHSENARELVWNRYRGTLSLRLDDDDAWILVVHTRWHEEDLTGKLLAAAEDETGDDWDVVRIPALAEAFDPSSDDPLLRMPDPLGREVGEPIEVEKFSRETVVMRAGVLGSYLAAALEQQRPSPEEGGEIMRGWWKWSSSFPPRFDASISSWDMKLKDKEAGDFVVGQVWGRTGSDYWLRDQMRGQWNMATVNVAIALTAVRHPDVDRHYIENTGNGPEVMAALRTPSPRYRVSDDIASKVGMTAEERPKVERLMRRGMSGLLPVNPKGDKRIRLRAQSGLIEAGNVHLREGDPGAQSLVNEAAAFPNGDHDDQVDALSQALSKLRTSGGKLEAPTRRVPKPTPGARPPSRATRGTGAAPQPRQGGARKASIARPQARVRGPGRRT